MRYLHNVLFNFNLENLNIRELNDVVAKFKQINGVEKAFFGENITPETDKTGGYNYGLTVIFDSYENLINYANAAIHLEFKKLIKGRTNSVRVMDFSLTE